MESYVYLTTILATVFLCWVLLELLGRPIRALFELRRKVREQLLVRGNIPLPKPRETAVSSREIHEYDQAMRNAREAQRVFSELGSRLLSFSENEPGACKAVAAFGLNPLVAGSGLVRLSAAYSRRDTDRRVLCNQIEKALRLTDAAPIARRQLSNRRREIQYQTRSAYGRDMSLSS
jgi:hypothetical protein